MPELGTKNQKSKARSNAWLPDIDTGRSYHGLHSVHICNKFDLPGSPSALSPFGVFALVERKQNTQASFCAPASVPDAPQRTIEAVEFVRRLAGQSQPALIGGSDGHRYVVKMLGNPKGPNVLANEALASMLLKEIRISAPSWTAIHLSDEFLDAHPQLWFRTECGRQRPLAGFHFASQLIVDVNGCEPYQIIPQAWISHIENPDDYAGVLAFDIWSGGHDRRKSVFARTAKAQSIRAYFVDHCHCFGGPDGHLARPAIADWARPRLLVYREVFNRDSASLWELRIRGVVRSGLAQCLAQVPDEWTQPGWRDQVGDFLTADLSQTQDAFEQLTGRPLSQEPSRRASYASRSEECRASQLCPNEHTERRRGPWNAVKPRPNAAPITTDWGT